ncbi:MAG: mechanosensitive ion channel protein MscS [Crocinitomicaceae bacterium]|nr:mechanosensitive ion channel protein MscS [Crocinitomicaceae bacterium]|tara:strand:- start:3849 stop:4670 length:822 start_codon:yes stop_codon:yes gene_type:complete
MDSIDFTSIYDIVLGLVVEFGTKIIGGLAVLIIGFWIISMIMKGVRKGFDQRDISPSLKPFLTSLIATLLKALVVISALSVLGIEMTSFAAILGAAGLAVGMALSGTLQNFAGGVIILIFKPYEVGDVIEAQGYIGSVKAIRIFNTILNTPDNKVIIIPNGPLSTGSLVNFSKEETRRVDWTVGIGYGDDFDKAKSVLLGFIQADKRILTTPEPFVALAELADSSVNLTVRVWVNPADYWGVFFDMNEKIYKNFEKEGLNIPFPQMDVHVHNS